MLKRNELSSHEKIWRKLKWTPLGTKKESERIYSIWFQLYDILEKVNYEDSVKISGLEERVNRQSIDDF
jgi:hypothetical protein